MFYSSDSQMSIECFHLSLLRFWPKKAERVDYILLNNSRFSLKKSSVKIHSIIIWIPRHESKWGTVCSAQNFFTPKRGCGWMRQQGRHRAVGASGEHSCGWLGHPSRACICLDVCQINQEASEEKVTRLSTLSE